MTEAANPWEMVGDSRIIILVVFSCNGLLFAWRLWGYPVGQSWVNYVHCRRVKAKSALQTTFSALRLHMELLDHQPRINRNPSKLPKDSNSQYLLLLVNGLVFVRPIFSINALVANCAHCCHLVSSCLFISECRTKELSKCHQIALHISLEHELLLFFWECCCLLARIAEYFMELV